MAVLDQEHLTCRRRAYSLKSLLPQQSMMGVLWQMQRVWKEERSEHIYPCPDTQNNDFSFQYNLIYQSVFEQALSDVDNLDKRMAVPDGWTRVCHGGEMEGCSQTSQGEEEEAALVALMQQGIKSQPGTYHCSSHSSAALVTVSDNKTCMGCALM